jgi:hypothetical protein
MKNIGISTILFWTAVISLGVLTRFHDLLFHYVDWDEAELMSISWAMTRGQVLYRDIPHFHPLFHFFLFAPFFRVFSPEAAPHWIKGFNLLCIVAGAGLVRRIGGERCRDFWSALAAALFFVYFLGVPDWSLSSYGEFYALFPVLAAARLLLSPRRLSSRETLVVGMLFGTAFFFKQTAAFDAAALLAAAGFIKSPSRKEAVRSLLRLCAGFATVLGAALLYPLYHGSIPETLNSIFFKNVLAYVQSGDGASGGSLNRLSVAAFRFAYILKTVAGEFFSTPFRWAWIALLATVAGSALTRRVRRAPSAREPFYLPTLLLWFATAVLGLVVIGRFFTHYLIQLVPIAALILCALLANTPRIPRVALSLVFAFLFLLGGVRHFRERERSVSRPPESVRKSRRIASWVRKNTRPDDTVFLFGEQSLDVHYLSGRLSPNGIYMFIVMDARHTNNPAIQETSRRRLLDDPPTAIVMGTFSSERCSREARDFVTRLVNERYVLDRTVEETRLFLKRDQASDS